MSKVLQEALDIFMEWSKTGSMELNLFKIISMYRRVCRASPKFNYDS